MPTLPLDSSLDAIVRIQHTLYELGDTVLAALLGLDGPTSVFLASVGASVSVEIDASAEKRRIVLTLDQKRSD